uniref:Uncharacterized protein n=1 Tax=Candidatus Methanogaster sp. ANME-2c ERB4 TaxID=2759911 RepID=A0A7G9YAY4_9EURY|nr:hypothetical protein GMDKAGHH_00021 [Methanosarcinales archaeon ANME-2c ERB4]QNO46030.1 hypothetical protein OOGCPJEC_00015 [Methanosarcinales archaeon ANME-2c ERB4]
MKFKSCEIKDFRISLFLKSMRSISRDAMSSGIMPYINNIYYEELFIIFGCYVAQIKASGWVIHMILSKYSSSSSSDSSRQKSAQNFAIAAINWSEI